MPVVLRRKALPPRDPATDTIEALLRDAAAFEAGADVPEGLAYRALARQIARQDRAERPASPRRHSGVAAALLGSLSLGTLTGAAAAVVLCLHTGTVPIAEPAASPSPRTATEGKTEVLAQSAEGEAITRAAVAALPTPRKDDMALRSPEERRTVTPRFRPRAQVTRSAPHGDAVRETTASSRPAVDPGAKAEREKPVAVRWRTETIDQTAYQLVATGYVATPAGDGDSDAVVTPVQLQAGIEPADGGSETVAPIVHAGL